MQKISPDIQACKATAVVKDGKIQLLGKHNHDPDERIYGRLSARKVVRVVIRICVALVHIRKRNYVGNAHMT